MRLHLFSLLVRAHADIQVPGELSSELCSLHHCLATVQLRRGLPAQFAAVFEVSSSFFGCRGHGRDGFRSDRIKYWLGWLSGDALGNSGQAGAR